MAMQNTFVPSVSTGIDATCPGLQPALVDGCALPCSSLEGSPVPLHSPEAGCLLPPPDGTRAERTSLLGPS